MFKKNLLKFSNLSIIMLLLLACPNVDVDDDQYNEQYNNTYVEEDFFDKYSEVDFSHITSSSVEPISSPDLGINVHMDFYTIDELTPEGALYLLLAFDNDGVKEYEKFPLMLSESNINGIRRYQTWVNFQDIEDYSVYDFYNHTIFIYSDSGVFANTLAGYTADGYHRKIQQMGDYAAVNKTIKLYRFRELIRHWEGEEPSPGVSLSGRFVDKSGNPYSDIEFNISVMHSTFDGSRGSGHRILEAISKSDGTFEILIPNIRLAPVEDQELFKDNIAIRPDYKRLATDEERVLYLEEYDYRELSDDQELYIGLADFDIHYSELSYSLDLGDINYHTYITYNN